MPATTKRGRGRPLSSCLWADVDGILDKNIRKKRCTNASSARHRYTQKQKFERMEEDLQVEVQRRTRLTIRADQLEKEVEENKVKIHDLLRRLSLMEQVVIQAISQPIIQVVPKSPTISFHPIEELLDLSNLSWDPVALLAEFQPTPFTES